MTIRRRLCIIGHVQGVFYRNWFVGEARMLGIDGWIRNRADGSVEALVKGPEELVDAIIDRARIGPAAANVEEVRISEDGSTDTLEGFAKRPTA